MLKAFLNEFDETELFLLPELTKNHINMNIFVWNVLQKECQNIIETFSLQNLTKMKLKIAKKMLVNWFQ